MASNLIQAAPAGGAGTLQWLRKVSLIIGNSGSAALDFSQFRFTFHVQRGDIQTPNSLRVRIYNLADATAKQVQKEFTRVVLQAGYEGNYGIIFDGTLIQARRGRENQTDTYLDITAADGDKAYNWAFVNTTLAAGHTMRDKVNMCLKAMEPYGVTAGYIADLPSNPSPRGATHFGLARDIMHGVARTTQSVWSIQDGKLVMYPETSYMPGTIPVITSATGMIGLPEQTSNGIKVRMLLNPSIKIGTLMKIDNASVQQWERPLAISQQGNQIESSMQNRLDSDGYYYVMLAEHWGDTRGNDYYTEATCLAVDATVIKGFVDRAVTPDASVVVVPKNL